MKDFWNQIPNWIKVILSSLISIFIIVHFECFYSLFSYVSNDEIIKQGGFWTLFSLIVSAPIAFAIWSFRDRNATDQINNSRKDTNLKEYHKIVEWMTDKDSSDELKISAIYYLRRFYEDKSLGFQQTALHLLLSTWESMQKNELEKLKTVNDPSEAKSIINSLRKNGNSPLGIAITNVLLSNNGECILAYPEIFPSICLAGMNFYLPGLSDDIVNKLFNDNIKCSGIQLQGCKFKNLNLDDVDFSNANLLGTEWGIGESQDVSFWNKVDFTKCDLRYSKFNKIFFKACDFSHSDFTNTILIEGRIDASTLFKGTNLISSSVIFTDIDENKNFLGSIIFESDLFNWIYYFKDDFEYYQENYTLEDIKRLGMFVLYKGDESYKLCELNLRYNSKLIPYNLFHFLRDISISNDKTKVKNDDWTAQIKEIL